MAHKNTLAGFADCNGTLIFGGIDTKKFAGELIRLKTFNIGYGKRRKSASTIFKEIGDVDSRPDNANDRIPTVRCDKANPDAYLALQLHGTFGAVIRVPLAGYFVPLNYTLGLPKKGPDFDPRHHGGFCSLMIRTNISPDGPTSKNWLVELGETFLHNAYMVYNFENRQIGVAPARYSTEFNIVPFASRGASTPLSAPGPAIETPVAYSISSQTFSEFPVAKIETLLAAPYTSVNS
ncbi:uncharacterized protein PG998_004196 [Apiospora kogelbergensis]|uniref:uncharacterized protein n=1 Tax=Apiospora kogelbergensis TaxID=1337665 RepID=UPI00312D5E96